MITFLRKIRQNLLVDNRFSKYLLYAIGEIVLVVIGILIALQINNWNEQRIESKAIAVYLQNLKDNLEEDIAHFDMRIEDHVYRMYALQHLLEISGEAPMYMPEYLEVLPVSKARYPISSGNFNLDMERTFRHASSAWPNRINNFTIEELKSTGLFSKITSKELKTSINNYYDTFETQLGERQLGITQKFIDRWYDSLIKDGVHPMDLSNVPDPRSLVAQHPERVAQIKALIANSRWTSYAANNALNRAKELVKLIDRELNKQ